MPSYIIDTSESPYLRRVGGDVIEDVYEEYFSTYRNEKINLLEIGVAHSGSIRLWNDYFKDAQIYGIDNFSCGEEIKNKSEDLIDGKLKNVKIICDDLEYNLVMDQNKTILELALENDIDAPYSCQGGICSTCLAKLNKGSVEMDNNQILTDDEIEGGYILSCQARPTSDEVEVNYDEV